MGRTAAGRIGYGLGYSGVAPTFTISNRMSSWWAQPKAVKLGTTLYVSGVTAAGASVVDTIDLVARTNSTSTLMTEEQDDHNAAALLVEADQVPLVFYARHNEDTLWRYRKGSTIGTIGGTQSTINFGSGNGVTYAQAFRRPGTDDVFAFARVDSEQWHVIHSDDWFATAPDTDTLFDFGTDQRGYMLAKPLASDPSILRIVAYGHPTLSTVHDIYYCTIDLDTGAVQNQAGSTLANLLTGTGLPLEMGDLDKVVDIDTGTYNARLYDVTDTATLRIAYQQWTGDSDARYWVATYNGSWSSTDLADAGEVFGQPATTHYNGGMTFDGDDIILSREDSGTWTIERWSLSGSWAGTVLASDSSDALVRPFTCNGIVLWHKVRDYDVSNNFDADADLVVMP